jgi:hypothetical protein
MISKLKIGEKFLITADEWFYAPDGNAYRAVHGTLKGIHNSEEVLGVKTNRGSTNWYVEIGNMEIAGCQIHYTIKCDNCNFSASKRELDHELESKAVTCPSRIYNADSDDY